MSVSLSQMRPISSDQALKDRMGDTLCTDPSPVSIYQQLLASSKCDKLSSTNLLRSLLLTLPSLYTYLPDLPASTSPLSQLLSPCHLQHYQALNHCPPRLPLVFNTKRVAVFDATLHYHLLKPLPLSPPASRVLRQQPTSAAKALNQYLNHFALSRSNP